MRNAMFALTAALLLPGAALAAPPKPRQIFDVSPDRLVKPATYTVGGVSVRVSKQADPQSRDLIRLSFVVSAKGMKPVTITAAETMSNFGHKLAIGQLNKGDKLPSVLIQGYSGGAHCCTSVDVAVPVGASFRAVSLAAWDGEGLDTFPTDLTGDGLADFRFVDNAFLYSFASYADSWAPPIFYNIIADGLVEVSTRPAFAKFYAKDMAEARKHCRDAGPNGYARNGACASYGASAARLGTYPAARAEIVKNHDPRSGWDNPSGCAVPLTEAGCPDGQEIKYASFPLALDAFLKDQGYLK